MFVGKKYLAHFIIGPCETVHIELPSDARFPDSAGTYKLRSNETTNGHQYWLSSYGKYAMWYGKRGYWVVGRVQYRDTSRVFMYTAKSTHSSPVEVGTKWKYLIRAGYSKPTDGVKVTCRRGK